MNDTVIVNGREYKVEVLPPKHEMDDGRSVYRLIGKRGARYLTLRNKPNPTLLFLHREGVFGFGVMEGVWLTDKDGILAQVRF